MKNALFRVGMLACLIFGQLLMPSTARADDFCNDTVVDQAQLFQNRTQEVQDAFRQFDDIGSVGKAWTFSELGTDESLESRVETTLRNCPLLLDTSGDHMKENLVVIAVSMKPKGVLVFYGGNFTKTLGGGNSNAIQGEVMAPLLSNGAYADAFIDGAAATIDSVNRTVEAPPANDSNTTPPTTSITGDASGLLWVLSALGVIVAVVVVVYFGRKFWIFVIVPIRQKRQDYRDKLEKIQSLYGKISESYGKLMQRSKSVELNSAITATWDDLRHDALTQAQEFETQLSQLETTISTFQPNLVNKETVDDWLTQLQAANASARTATQLADKVDSDLEGINYQVENAQNQLSSLPDELDQIQSRGSELLKHVVVALPGFDERIEQIRAQSQAQSGASQQELVKINKHCQELTNSLLADMQQVETKLRQIQTRPGKITHLVSQLREQVASFASSAHAATLCEYGVDVSTSITKAETALQIADDRLLELSEINVRDVSTWDKAFSIIADAENSVADALRLINELKNQYHNLAKAQKDLPALTNEASAAIDRLGELRSIVSSDTQVDIPGTFKKSQASLNRLKKASKPAIYATCAELSELVGTVRSQITQVEQDSSQVAQLRTDLTNTISSAKRNLQEARDFRARYPHYNGSYDRDLDQAERLLKEAQAPFQVGLFDELVTELKKKTTATKKASRISSNTLSTLQSEQRRRSYTGLSPYGSNDADLALGIGLGLALGSGHDNGGLVGGLGGGSSSGFSGGGLGGGSSSSW